MFFNRKPPRGVYTGGGRILTKTKSGLKIYVDGGDISVAPHIILDSAYEENTEGVIRKLVRPGMTILEGGANIGYFTLAFASLTGAQGRVIAFEADTKNAQFVLDNLELNGFSQRATVYAQALFSSDGEVTFYRAVRHRGNGSILRDLEQTPENPEAQREALIVPSRSIDSLCAEHGISPDVIKLDAEGAESSILAGAQSQLTGGRPRVLILEFTPRFISLAGDDPRRLLEDLLARGYRLNRIVRKRRMEACRIDELLESESTELVALR